MTEKMINLEEFGLSDQELFAPVSNDKLASEKITAPRYSYWRSVFRVFFRKKLNIIALSLLAFLIIFSYVYPMVIGYDATVDPYINLMDETATHLKPMKAMEKFGYNIHWILGAGASGQSTFDAVWYGSRLSISLAFICAAINMTMGVIIGAIWGTMDDGSVKKLQVNMANIRKKLGCRPGENRYIINELGVGYRMLDVQE